MATRENKEFEGFQSDLNGLNYKLAQAFGNPDCASLDPISDRCQGRLAVARLPHERTDLV